MAEANEKRILESDGGYVLENEKEQYIRIFEASMINYDGIYERGYRETKITYRNGLYQEWGVTGYYADFFTKYKDREYVIGYAKQRIGIKD